MIRPFRTLKRYLEFVQTRRAALGVKVGVLQRRARALAPRFKGDNIFHSASVKSEG